MKFFEGVIIDEFAMRVFLILLLGLSMLAPRAAPAEQTVLYFFGEPASWVGEDQEATFTTADGNFSAVSWFSNTVALASFATPNYSQWWSLSFGPARGQVLAPGSYENTQRQGFQTGSHPGLEFYGNGRGCNTSIGRYDLLEYVRDSRGNLVRMAIDFEQRCSEYSGAVFGQFRYNSNVPLSPKPIRIRLNNPKNSQLCVEASSPAGAIVNLSATNAVDAEGGQQLAYSWSTSTGATGESPTFEFQAPLTPIPTNITLSLTDLTNGITQTLTRSVCVSDTVAPVITILRPATGATTYNDNVVLEVFIKDAADNRITSYEADLGTHVVSPLDPLTGFSRQLIQEAPITDGPVPTSITVHAKDASGNVGSATVQFFELFRNRRQH